MTQIKYIRPKFELEGSVAVVGSSVKVLDEEYGKEIDSYANIIRFNRQAVEGWEKHVGSKTTARLVNVHVFQNREVGRWKVDKDFAKRLRSTKLILLDAIPELVGQRAEHIDESIDLFLFDNTRLRDPTKRMVATDVGTRPSVGTSMVLALIHSGVSPTIYGWDVDKYAPLSHYWEDRDQLAPCHNVEKEREALRTLQDKGLLEIR